MTKSNFKITCLLLIASIHNVTSLMCYICGASDLQSPGECVTQFQYDCTTYADGFADDDPVLCRTLRRRQAANGTFTALKECIALSEHARMFPDKPEMKNGCETVFEGTDYEVAYCLCDGDFCNKPSVSQRMTRSRIIGVQQPVQHRVDPKEQKATFSVGAIPIALANVDSTPVQVRLSDQRVLTAADRFWAANLNRPPAWQIVHPEDTMDSIYSPSDYMTEIIPGIKSSKRQRSPTRDPIIVTTRHFAGSRTRQDHMQNVDFDYYYGDADYKDPQPSQFTGQDIAMPTQQTAFATTPRPMHLNPQGTAANVTGLVCMVCGEGDITGSNPECQEQYAVDCAQEYPLGTQVHCFTRHTKLTNDAVAIEKLCVTDLALREEYGETVTMNGCSNAWQQQVNYCVCTSTKCNEASIGQQMALEGKSLAFRDVTAASSPIRESDRAIAGETTRQPSAGSTLWPQDLPVTATPRTGRPARHCEVCGESDLTSPSDCQRTYEYDCSRQYPANDDVMCLTRLTQMPTGLFTIEKRCITAAEHTAHYPDNEVTVDGCGSAWDSYVQYCICSQDYCNMGNITEQQERLGYKGDEMVQTHDMQTEYPAPVAYPPEHLTNPPPSRQAVVTSPKTPRPAPARTSAPATSWSGGKVPGNAPANRPQRRQQEEAAAEEPTAEQQDALTEAESGARSVSGIAAYLTIVMAVLMII